MIDSYSHNTDGINNWHEMSDYDYKAPHLLCLQFALLRYFTVRLTVCLAWWVLLCCADSQSGMSFFETQQLAQTLPPLAKNTKQDASPSSDTSHFKPSLWMQDNSQPIGALVSGAEAAEMRAWVLMSGYVPACVGVVLFLCLHVCISVYFPPVCMFVYLCEACTPARTVQRSGKIMILFKESWP